MLMTALGSMRTGLVVFCTMLMVVETMATLRRV